jgi:hypothetical protein
MNLQVQVRPCAVGLGKGAHHFRSSVVVNPSLVYALRPRHENGPRIPVKVQVNRPERRPFFVDSTSLNSSISNRLFLFLCSVYIAY